MKLYNITNIPVILKVRFHDFKNPYTKQVIKTIVAVDEMIKAQSNPKYSEMDNSKTKFTHIANPTRAY